MKKRNNKMKKGIIIIGLMIFGMACSQESSIENPQFELLKKDKTGLDFENVLTPSAEFNVFKYMYFYNGGGVATGDFNNDGLEDLYFTSNMGENKMFLNEGDFKFKDITAIAKVEGAKSSWTTGVSVVDINNDGMLDLYVSQVGDYKILKGENQLFVCQGIENGMPIYENKAVDYGLNLVGFCTQAAFVDYDLDGDLDMFQVQHSTHANGTFGQKKEFLGTQSTVSGDKLMRNDNGQFTDVTLESGISSTVIGYGLGIVVGDVNQDGYPDIYIGNDFHEDDYLYINQGDGTFVDTRKTAIQHTSRFSMGVEMADINNDGKSEIVSLDMMPEDPFILKSSLGEDDFKIFRFKMTYGYLAQYARNNLQFNNGNGTFSEIGMSANMHATDWSWSPLFLDFDHDGYKDLFITNGIPHRMNDIDYLNFRKSDADVMWETSNVDDGKNLELMKMMPRIKIKNKFLRNTGKLGFDDLKSQIKNDEGTFSNGAVYVDLDNDGDLDLVVNNIEDEPFVYKNLTIDASKKVEAEAKSTAADYIHFDLKGSPKNINAIGTKMIIYKGKERIVVENFPVRGYQSSVQMGLHAGVGEKEKVDKVILVWSDNTHQIIENVAYNEVAKFEWKPNLPVFDYTEFNENKTYLTEFSDATADLGIEFFHKENPFVEFDREQLIPHMVSTEGPALAIGDLNGDGLEDFFIGSSKREQSAIFYQNDNGKFQKEVLDIFEQNKLAEDVDAKLVDIDNDNDLDIVVATGGNEYRGRSPQLQQYIYINQGDGNFTKDTLPNSHITASCVLPNDVNGDGLVDLFFGGRALSWNYGKTPNSYLYINRGNGKFEEATDEISKDLKKVGLVKDGEWADIDNDGDQDLILAMEWESILIFKNENGKLKKEAVNDMKGWWNFAKVADFDGDGDMDILGGNLGSNAKFKPTPQEPLQLYINDFDDNKQIEQILTSFVGEKETPYATYAELTRQLSILKKDYIYSKDLAKASMDELFGQSKLKEAIRLEVNTLESMYFENKGNMIFEAHPLPEELQWSALEAVWLDDFDGDLKKEVMLGGNFYDCNIEMGRYDASYGNILQIDKNSEMSVYPLGDLSVTGQVRRIGAIEVKGQKYFILAKNNDFLQIVKVD
jgi:hypothetical protein